MVSSLHFYHLPKIKLLYMGKPFCNMSLGLILCDNKVVSPLLIYNKKQKMSIERKKKMKDIFIENGERKFKLVPNITVDSLGTETVTVGVEEIGRAHV